MKYRIRTRILAGFILIISAIFIMNIISDIENHKQAEEAMAAIYRYQNAEALVVSITVQTNEEAAALRGYIRSKDQRYVIAFENNCKAVEQDLNSVESLLADDPDSVEIIRSEISPALNSLANIMTDVRNGQDYRGESDPVVELEDLLTARTKLLEIMNNRQAAALKSLTRYSRTSYQETLLFDGLITFLALVLGFFIARSITTELSLLIRAVRQVSEGDYQLLERLKANADVGELVIAFKNMIRIVQADKQDLEQHNEELQAQSEELTAQNEEILSQQEEIQTNWDKLSKQEAILKRLYNFSQSLTSTLDLEPLLNTVLASIVEEAGAEVGAILLYNQETKTLKIRTATGLTQTEDLSSWQLGEGLLGLAAQKKRMLVANYGEGQLKTKGLHGILALASEIYLPMVVNDNLLGVITVGRLDGDKFNSEEQQFLTTLADQAAVALDNAITHLDTRQTLLQIQELDHLKSELINTVSHELRTPLASILGFAELLLKKTNSPARATKYLETIYNEAVRLTGLINNFLDLQRMEAGRLEFTKSTVDLGRLINKNVELYQAQSSQHNLIEDIEDGLPLVRVDAERIDQVLGNLLSNAIKYSPSGGNVVVRAFCSSSDMVEVEVEDYGLGIPEDAQDNLFQPFFRVDNSDRRQIGGTGLGLAISRKIIRAHGGELKVRSVHGQGSIFTISLPIGKASAAPKPFRGKQEIVVSQANDKVLVVEDDQAMAALLVETLNGNGYTTKVVDNGAAVFTVVREELPAVIILDLTLAGLLDGWDVLRKLKQDNATSKVPVIISSCIDKRNMGVELGAADYFVKPFPINKLVESVHTLTRMADGVVGVPGPQESVDIEKNIRELLEFKGFVVQGVINREELLVITLGNQSLAEHEVI
ncbi:MAG: yycG 6 [Firmicutes bacterium]|nr:yycG 6 [Bacillota bacterium]